MPRRMSSASTEFIEAPVLATPNIDPMADVVEFAFMAGTDYSDPPDSGDWRSGLWHRNGTAILAACLVGPVNGGVVLDVGEYLVWVRITDNPEVPAIPVDVLTIF